MEKLLQDILKRKGKGHLLTDGKYIDKLVNISSNRELMKLFIDNDIVECDFFADVPVCIIRFVNEIRLIPSGDRYISMIVDNPSRLSDEVWKKMNFSDRRGAELGWTKQKIVSSDDLERELAEFIRSMRKNARPLGYLEDWNSSLLLEYLDEELRSQTE